VETYEMSSDPEGPQDERELDAFRLRVRHAMVARGVTLADLARGLGTSYATAQNLFRPTRKVFPYADEAQKLARALGVSLEYLITGEESAGSPPPAPPADPLVAELYTVIGRMNREMRVELLWQARLIISTPAMQDLRDELLRQYGRGPRPDTDQPG
jgi:transcriptional regulator with XRE-family HTH domain